jgi:hypothetical protein
MDESMNDGDDGDNDEAAAELTEVTGEFNGITL